MRANNNENNVTLSATKMRYETMLRLIQRNRSNSVEENAVLQENISQSEVQRGDHPQIVIIADDLTGACDSAAAFLRHGRRVWVWLSNHHFNPAQGGVDVWSFSTESRNETALVAEEWVKALSVDLQRQFPSTVFFKKVDSAGRGHFGKEMEAARVAICADVTVYAPAFPAAGRYVVGGVLHISDATRNASTINLQELFPQEMQSQVALIPAGLDVEVERSMLQAVADGKQTLLCDADSSADLQRIVRVARKLSQRLLWAGSAGLSFEFAQTLSAETHQTEIGTRRGGKTLIICGTPHALTQLQMEQLSEVKAEHHAYCAVERVDCATSTDEDLRRMFNDAGPVSSLVLTGGDTAAMVLRALDAESIEIAGEMSPGIPWGILHGGLADGCVVITKSGGFGDEHVLVDALYFCRGVIS